MIKSVKSISQSFSDFLFKIDIKKTVSFIILFNILDAILTLFWIDLGIAKESNPLMEYALDHGTYIFLFVKIALVSLGCLLLYRYRDKIFSRLAAVIALACYSSIVFYHSYGFYLAIF